MAEPIYPGILLRVKALVADSIVLLVLIVGTTFIFSKFDHVDDYYRIGAFIFIFVLYDPLFTSLMGGTIGHKMNGICVRRDADHDRFILFPMAIIRFLFKSLLGWISLLVVSGNQERKAIHDYIVGSVVLYEVKKTLQN